MLFALAVFAFLLGSIPFGFIVCRMKGVDIFSVGSGNIGATNVVRAVGPALGFLVFFLDVAKGLIPGLIAKSVLPDQTFGLHVQTCSFIVGCVAIIGHMFSPWIRFKGGKGIATGLGAMLAAIPVTAALSLAVFIPVTAVSRYVSLGSILAALSTIPFSLFVSKDSIQVLPILILFNIVVIVKHRSNIVRIMNGTENKFRFKKNDDGTKTPDPIDEEESKKPELNDEENRL